jgi:membrane protease YdiL (CAAX protease family)
MNKYILFKGLGIVFLVLCFALYITAAITGYEDPLLLGIATSILSIASFIFSYRYKKRESLSAPLASQSADNIPIIDTMATNNTQVIIPETCPHCKNPNTKRIRLCEWCGNQIV